MQNMPLNSCQQVNVQPQQQTVPQTCVTNPQQPVSYQPQVNYDTNGQTVQVPNYSGVNIQIFNPSAVAPGANPPVYNVNAPHYTTQPTYPQGYYTNNWGPNGQGANNTNDNATRVDVNGVNTTNTNSTTTTVNEDKKTVKKEVIMLTDSYIKNLENYLNSQDKEVRLMGAKEVAARLQEDPSRRDDKALTALINKMLQDPSQPIRFLALSMLDLRYCTGDDYTVGVLQNMQQSSSGYGQDGLQASQILLKMSGEPVKKEFNVEDLPQQPNKKGK